MRILLYLFALILALTFDYSNAEPIRGNNVKPVKEGQFSFVASIVRRSDDFFIEKNHICTGVLISEEHVLTAAHCFDNLLLGEMQIVLGSPDIRVGLKYEPSSRITYDQWLGNKTRAGQWQMVNYDEIEHDIAIIELSRKVNKHVAKPIPVSKKKYTKLCSKNVTMTGWGLTNDVRHRPSRYLQMANTVVLTEQQCKYSISRLTDRPVPTCTDCFCSQAQPYTLLDCGDSGGPLVSASNKLVGMSIGDCPSYNLAHSKEMNLRYRVNIHLSVYYYKSFINDVLRNW